MEKLQLCRICLVDNVRMHAVVDKNVHKLYKMLTDVSFVTDDRRPMLACFFCFAKLKQCYHLQRKCLEAEQLLDLVKYERNPVINRGQLEFFNGYMITLMENINIVEEVGQIESIPIKQEEPAGCERLDDFIEREEEHQSEDIKLENVDNDYSDVEDTPAQQSTSDSEDDVPNVPVTNVKTEVEEEQQVSKRKRKADNTGSPYDESSMTITREDMFNVIKQCDYKNLDKKLDFLEHKLIEMTKCPEDKTKVLRHCLKSFKHHYKLKWTSASYKECRFRKTNEQWLKGKISLPVWRHNKPGRPLKEFQECSERSKRRKTEKVRSEISHEELTYAAVMSERAAGNNDLSQIIKQASATPRRATRFRKIISSADKSSKSGKLTITQALIKYVEADLTRKQYNVIRDGQEDIYPCYSLLQRAKTECYPKSIVSESIAEITLQDLLDHTTQRLCLYLQKVLMTATEIEGQNMELICKWGCDGSKAQEFKQKFQDESGSDAHVFISSLVPLRLTSNVNGQLKIWWQNPAPSSCRFCRPIRIQFVHENNEVTRSEIAHIENQAQNINPTEVEADNKVIKVSHTLVLTMVDGKVCNAATNTTSTMKCYICKQTSKDFNNLKTDESLIDSNSLKFGLSILHARIRFLETCLHIAYKLPIKKWRLNKEEKQLSADKKKEIQEAFREQMGLLVDVPKAGFGNTNDGNTSRRFFADPVTTASITGIDINFLKNLKLILEVISSGFSIDTEKFSVFLKSTAELYVQLYNWHPMTPTLHKVLCHGALVIKHALLPIGQLSEEAAESRNKHFRLYRQNFARKFSRKNCLQDVMNRLLLTSDVFLSSSSRMQFKRNRKPLSQEILQFLKVEYECPADTDTDNADPGTSTDQADSDSESDEY